LLGSLSRSGRLRSKAYAGEPLTDTEYTYSLAGRPATRVWQRNVTTSYTTTPAGEVDVVTYSVGVNPEMQTAPLRFGYDRLGRRNTIKTYLPGTLATSILSATPPAPVSTLSQTDNDLGEPETESWSGGPLAGRSVTTSVAGQQFEYGFDDIGNRVSQKRGGDANGANLRSTTYVVNPLNQITNRTVVGSRYLDLIGLAEPGTTVTAGGVIASRRGEFWRAELNLGNGNPLWQSVNITTSDGGSLANALYRVPPSSEVPTYDADGNLTADGLWTYTWDAENRLISMQSQALVPTAGRRKLDVEYDPLGRRIGRIVSTGASGSWVVTSTTRWLYEGWNPVAELNGAGTLVREYVWGSDLSGSWQGAGGFGGLLWVIAPPTGPNINAHYAAYDGNGNVMGVVNGTDRTWSARYEYGPFGEVVRATGTMAAANPFRWSTKIQDEDTGLNYYGYRYYSAGVGRWLGRDPIEETGGYHINTFIDNDGVNFFDLDGLEKGVEGLDRLGRNGHSAFGDTPINPLNGLQLLVGLPFSVLSGDIFFNDIEKIPTNTCNILITVNGIFTSRTNANSMLQDLISNSPRSRGLHGIAAGNRATYVGDILQIVGDEFGAIQSASFALARQINQAYDSFNQNGCCCGTIQVLAHSQGTKTFKRALSLVKPEARKMIFYTGIGGQTRISPDGLGNAENYRNIYDPVPYSQFLNPVNWPTQPEATGSVP
jgi:RHS repeat-associated protein